MSDHSKLLHKVKKYRSYLNLNVSKLEFLIKLRDINLILAIVKN